MAYRLVSTVGAGPALVGPVENRIAPDGTARPPKGVARVSTTYDCGLDPLHREVRGRRGAQNASVATATSRSPSVESVFDTTLHMNHRYTSQLRSGTRMNPGTPEPLQAGAVHGGPGKARHGTHAVPLDLRKFT